MLTINLTAFAIYRLMLELMPIAIALERNATVTFGAQLV